MTATITAPVTLAIPWPEFLLDAMGYRGRYAQLRLWWEPHHELRVCDGDQVVPALDMVPWQLLESTERFRRILSSYDYRSRQTGKPPLQALAIDASRRQFLAGEYDAILDYVRHNRQTYNALSPGDEQYQAIEFEFVIRAARQDRAYRQLRDWLARIA